MNSHPAGIPAIDHVITSPWFALFIFLAMLAALWDGVWKMIALWKSARNGQMAWFVCLAVFNTLGILPIIYILLCQRNAQPETKGLAPV